MHRHYKQNKPIQYNRLETAGMWETNPHSITGYRLQLVKWCFEPCQSQRITSGLYRLQGNKPIQRNRIQTAGMWETNPHSITGYTYTVTGCRKMHPHSITGYRLQDAEKHTHTASQVTNCRHVGNKPTQHHRLQTAGKQTHTVSQVTDCFETNPQCHRLQTALKQTHSVTGYRLLGNKPTQYVSLVRDCWETNPHSITCYRLQDAGKRTHIPKHHRPRH